MPKNHKLIVHEYGEDINNIARIEEEEIRPLKEGEVLIRTEHIGINAVYDREMYRGNVPYLSLNPPFKFGVESVGVISEIGSSVTTFRAGETVSLNKVGTAYQEYIIAEATDLVAVPDATKEYLTLNPTGVSAWLALEMLGQAKEGETIVISAAAGGLGHILCQLCHFKGCNVVGICGSSYKKKFLESLNCCSRVINYKEENIDDVLSNEYNGAIDIAFDSVGRHVFDSMLKNMAQLGRLIIIGLASELMHQEFEIVTRARCYEQMYWKGISIRCFMNHLYKNHHSEARNALFDMYHSGKLKVCPDKKTFIGLDSIVKASNYLLEGKSCGKVCVSMR